LSTARTLSRFALGAAAGLTLAYGAVRALEALDDRRTPIPPRTRDPKAYGTARRTLTVVGLIRAVAGLGVWAFGLSDAAERALQPLPRPLRLPLFAGAVVVAESLRDWPADYVEDYVLERIYGTSERSAGAWASDRLKSIAVGAGATTLIVALGDAVVHRAPRRWPWLTIAATPALLAFANVIVPTFIMPLFNTYVPVEGELEARIRALADRYGVGGATILRFDMSRQTKKANAFVTGVFGTQRIALADTLINEFQDDETLFVVAHELGHYVRKDPWSAIALGTVLLGATLLGAVRAIRRTTGRNVDGIATGTRLAFYATLGQLAAMPLANAFSRALERRADRFALAATGDAESGIRAFRRLRDQNLAEDEGPKWSELIFSSHPSLRSRIAALEAATGAG
jgi:STE24 endopeptidase